MHDLLNDWLVLFATHFAHCCHYFPRITREEKKNRMSKIVFEVCICQNTPNNVDTEEKKPAISKAIVCLADGSEATQKKVFAMRWIIQKK